MARSIRLGDIDGVQGSLAAGADPNERKGTSSSTRRCSGEQSCGDSRAAHRGWADVGWTSDNGWSALTYADANEFDALADRLIQFGAPIGSRLAHGYTQLHRAARRGDAEAIAALVQSIGTETPTRTATLLDAGGSVSTRAVRRCAAAGGSEPEPRERRVVSAHRGRVRGTRPDSSRRASLSYSSRSAPIRIHPATRRCSVR